MQLFFELRAQGTFDGYSHIVLDIHQITMIVLMNMDIFVEEFSESDDCKILKMALVLKRLRKHEHRLRKEIGKIANLRVFQANMIERVSDSIDST